MLKKRIAKLVCLGTSIITALFLVASVTYALNNKWGMSNMTSSRSVVLPGNPITFSVSVVNSSTLTVSHVSVYHPIAAGQFVTVTGHPGLQVVTESVSGTLSGTLNMNIVAVQWSGSIAPFAPMSYTLQLKPNTPGLLTSTVYITDATETVELSATVLVAHQQVYLALITASANPPYVPSGPEPPDGSSMVPPGNLTLRWTDGDRDSSVVTYTVMMHPVGGSLLPPICIGPETECVVTDLEYGTAYEWQVTAQDGTYIVSGPTWVFTTASASLTIPLDLLNDARSLSSWGYNHQEAYDPSGSHVWDSTMGSFGMQVNPLDYGAYYITRSYVEVLIPTTTQVISAARLHVNPCVQAYSMTAPIAQLHLAEWTSLTQSPDSSLWHSWTPVVIGALDTSLITSDCSSTETIAISLDTTYIVPGEALQFTMRDSEDHLDLRPGASEGDYRAFGHSWIDSPIWLELIFAPIK